MNFGKKLATLLRAAARGALPSSKEKRGAQSYDPESQLADLQTALAAVEAKEQEVANLLKEAQSKATIAQEKGDREESSAQQRLVAKLDAQLSTQSRQAISLTAQVERMQNAKEESSPEASKLQDENASLTDASEERTNQRPPDDDTDLQARKSRLSG